ncbi:hypothetical protein ONZ51_g4827 [Trametes cubensis]|uniref:F-box domain-containing protein n=1 Tax=Trametes cubensis TaxID=1111947 RepID=A0AAD7XE90_9APHY|nr:hypothetical protein ONZ51_g4827 [Trametes cubensis]
MSREFNATRPINTLPVEILLNIFLNLQTIEEPGGQIGWYGVAAVCRHWRDVANSSSCASLWRQMSFTTSSGLISTDIFLTGSGATFLGGWGHSKFITETMNSSLGRKRLLGAQGTELEPSVCDYDNGAPVQCLLERYAPLMEVLEVDCHYVPGHHGDDVDYSERYGEVLLLSIDPRMFARLQCLSLYTAGLKPNPAPLPSLCRLHLSYCICTSMSMEDFFAFVTGCQALEELSLCKFRPADPAFPDVVRGRKDLEKIAPLTPVTPPAALRKLHLHDFAPFTARILQGMSLARSTDLSVTMDGHIRTLDQAYRCKTVPSLYTAFPLNSTHLGVLHGVTAVHVYFGTPTVYRIVARSGEEGHGSVTITADVPAPAAYQSTPQHKARAKYRPNRSKDLIELFGGAPVSDLTIVAPNAEHWKTLTGADWANTLRSLPFLKRLSVIFHPAGDCLLGVGEDDPLMTLITVLGTPPDDEDELCPHLECLTLHSSDVDLGVEIARTARTARIVDCLRIRKARGFPLAQLHILFDPDQGSSDDERERYARVFTPHVDVVDFEDTAVEFETARSI